MYTYLITIIRALLDHGLWRSICQLKSNRLISLGASFEISDGGIKCACGGFTPWKRFLHCKSYLRRNHREPTDPYKGACYAVTPWKSHVAAVMTPAWQRHLYSWHSVTAESPKILWFALYVTKCSSCDCFILCAYTHIDWLMVKVQNAAYK